VLTVQDNGLGIEAGRMDQLFTMFRRFHDHVEGSGIGLYMIKKMVENVGGKIEAESQVGQGSTFRIYFRR
jgi:signal transduction histidine kinase